MRGPGGCLTKLVLILVGAVVFVWAVTVALNPWALHIGGRSTPLLYWHGAGKVVSKDGKTYPLYVTFSPGKPRRTQGRGARASAGTPICAGEAGCASRRAQWSGWT